MVDTTVETDVEGKLTASKCSWDNFGAFYKEMSLKIECSETSAKISSCKKQWPQRMGKVN